MRLILSTAIGALAFAGLAACGQSEESLRSTTREALLLGCRNGDATARAQLTQAGVSVDQFCTCSIDRYMQSATTEQLKQISRNPTNVPGLEAASMQCIAEMTRQSGATPGAPPAANEAAAPPATSAEPADPAETGAAEENATNEE